MKTKGTFGAETEPKREIVRKKEEEEDDGEQTPPLIGTHTLSLLELFKSSSRGEDKSMAAPFYIPHLLHFLLSFDLLFLSNNYKLLTIHFSKMLKSFVTFLLFLIYTNVNHRNLQNEKCNF